MARSVRKIFELVETTETAWKWYRIVAHSLNDENGELWGFHDDEDSLDELRMKFYQKAKDFIKTPEDGFFITDKLRSYSRDLLLEEKIEYLLSEELTVANTKEKVLRIYKLASEHYFLGALRQRALMEMPKYFFEAESPVLLIE